MAQPTLSQLAADLVPGQWVPVRRRTPRARTGRAAVAVSATTTRWPGLITAVDHVDPSHVAITIRVVTQPGERSEHIRTLPCGSRIAVLTQHHAVCRCCGQLAPCPSEHLERTVEAAMHIDLASIVGADAEADR